LAFLRQQIFGGIMKNSVGWLAAAAIVIAIVVAACSGYGPSTVVGGPILTQPQLNANQVPNIIPTVRPGSVTKYPVPTASSFPTYITSAGGDLWFSETQANNIGRITTAGVLTEFPAGVATGPYDIITGPDGSAWFGALTAQGLGRIDSSGGVTLVPIPTFSAHPEQLVADKPHNSIWFAERVGQKIGVYNLTTKSITEYPVPPPPGKQKTRPTGIALDRIGNVWFSDWLNDQVVEMSNTGTLLQRLSLPGSNGSPFSLGAWYMTLGNDGNLWLTEATGGPKFTGAIARINPRTSVINTFVPRGANPSTLSLANGPRGIWLPPEGAGQLVRMGYSGATKEWVIPGSSGYGVVEGPDKNMWYVDWNSGYVARVKVNLLP
jgi:virginiamycin B lyase